MIFFSSFYPSSYIGLIGIKIYLTLVSGSEDTLVRTRGKINNLMQCCAAHCSTMLCCTLSTTVVNNHCSQLFKFNNHCSIIVDNDQQAVFINYCYLLFQQHCNNYCFVNIEQLLIEQYLSTMSIQQVLLNLDNNIVQALLNEQRCVNLINFCACSIV